MGFEPKSTDFETFSGPKYFGPLRYFASHEFSRARCVDLASGSVTFLFWKKSLPVRRTPILLFFISVISYPLSLGPNWFTQPTDTTGFYRRHTSTAILAADYHHNPPLCAFICRTTAVQDTHVLAVVQLVHRFVATPRDHNHCKR